MSLLEVINLKGNVESKVEMVFCSYRNVLYALSLADISPEVEKTSPGENNSFVANHSIMCARRIKHK